MDTQSQITKSSKTTKKSSKSTASSWVVQVNRGLALRAEGEAIIAKALRERLDQVGEAVWLQQCEREWGWSRSTCYRHLEPKQMEAARAHTCEQREAAKVPTVGTSPIAEKPDRKPRCCTKRYGSAHGVQHAPDCPDQPSPPLYEQKRLIEQAHQNEALDAQPFTPEYEPEMGEGWVQRAIRDFEQAAEILSREETQPRLGTEGRARARTAAQSVLDALDPKPVVTP